MIGEMYTPPMYRDAISGGMPMYELDPTMMGMGSMYGGMCDPMMMGMYGGCYNTNYLGGVSLRPNLSRDTVNIINKKDKDANEGISKFGKVMLGVLAFGIVSTYLKGKFAPKKSSSFFNFSMPNFSRPTGSKTWYKPWTWLNKSAATP